VGLGLARQPAAQGILHRMVGTGEYEPGPGFAKCTLSTSVPSRNRPPLGNCNG